MSSLSRRACFKCGNVGHYAGKPHTPRALLWRTLQGDRIGSNSLRIATFLSAVPAPYNVRAELWHKMAVEMRLTRPHRSVLILGEALLQLSDSATACDGKQYADFI